jgi:hypothetical protein
LDIAGRSNYCDETGDDYYDFRTIGESKYKKIPKDSAMEDDITLVVIKVEKDLANSGEKKRWISNPLNCRLPELPRGKPRGISSR